MGSPTFKDDALIGHLTYYSSQRTWDLDINKKKLGIINIDNHTLVIK